MKFSNHFFAENVKCISDEFYQVGKHSDCKYVQLIRYAEDHNVNYFPKDETKSLK